MKACRLHTCKLQSSSKQAHKSHFLLLLFSSLEESLVLDPAVTCIQERGHRQELALADSKWGRKKSGSDRPVGPRGCVSLESRQQEALGVCSCERTTPSPASYMRAMCAVTNPFIKHAGLHGRAACTQCPSIWPLDGGIVQLN